MKKDSINKNSVIGKRVLIIGFCVMVGSILVQDNGYTGNERIFSNSINKNCNEIIQNLISSGVVADRGWMPYEKRVVMTEQWLEALRCIDPEKLDENIRNACNQILPPNIMDQALYGGTTALFGIYDRRILPEYYRLMDNMRLDLGQELMVKSLYMFGNPESFSRIERFVLAMNKRY